MHFTLAGATPAATCALGDWITGTTGVLVILFVVMFVAFFVSFAIFVAVTFADVFIGVAMFGVPVWFVFCEVTFVVFAEPVIPGV